MSELRIVLFLAALLAGFGALVHHADACARRADFPAKQEQKREPLPHLDQSR